MDLQRGGKLWCRLILDAITIGLPVNEVELSLRAFSKTYYGNYYPKYSSNGRPRVYIYPCKDRKGTLYDYDFILDTLIHEMVHHIQHTSEDYVRLKGVMHDQEFWKLYNKFIYKAKIAGVMSDDYESQVA